MKLPIEQIRPDPNQPRKVFSDEYIKGLAGNLAVEGMINAIEIDENNMIITGECRWRAAKLAGWTEVPVNINKSRLGEYERFRRQMSENLHQSSANGGTPMNAIDVAKGYKRLLEMKGYDLSTPSTERVDSGLHELSKELSVSADKISKYLNMLFEPKYVRQAIIKDSSKFSQFERARRLPEKITVQGREVEVREPIRKAIVEDKITGHKHIEKFSALVKARPDKAELELIRLIGKQSSDANKILDRALELQVALKNAEPKNWMASDLSMVRGQLGSTTGAIRTFVGKINKVDGIKELSEVN